MKVLTVVGARPQFIKSAPVSKAFIDAGIEEFIVHTGQHYDPSMSAVFFDQLGLPKPIKTLSAGGLGRDEMIASIRQDLIPILRVIEPDYVLVYGDTNSTLAGALAANEMNIPVVHVEAGLRSFNDEMPEELNRIQTDELSKILFTPSLEANKNIEAEGFLTPHQKVEMVGDVMYDALLMFKEFGQYSEGMGPIEFFDTPFALATLHRQENVKHSNRLEERILTLNALHNSGLNVWMPLHPSTKKQIESSGIRVDFKTAEPVGYLEMIWLLGKAKIVLTDSGGLQKEAYFMHTPCITLRNETEWVELVESGANTLFPLGTPVERIIDAVSSFDPFNKPKANLYGKGNSAALIAESLKNSV